MVADCFQQKKIVIERKVDERLPEVLVDGDKMRQVILNVLRNACEAIEETGKISLSASLAGDGRLKKIRIRISDSGCGIPEKDWENIFEPFFTTKPSGFGLGLANARKIVEQHKGTIRVVKKRSPGTSFEILIPCEGEP
jgi:signal transduction histidine kinase